MKDIADKVDFLIQKNKENLLDSQSKYGGVYIARINLGQDLGFSIEVELNEGSIAFSLPIKEGTCLSCNHEEFTASQVCRVSVVVDAKNHFIKNQGKRMEEAVFDADDPYGTYSCVQCGKEYEDLNELFGKVDKVCSKIKDNLENEGIFVYDNYELFEEALNESKP